MAVNSFFDGLFNKFKFNDDSQNKNTSRIATDNIDGAIELENIQNEYTMQLNWGFESQAELIKTYREISNYSMVDYAIEDIVNECISFLDDEEPITLILDHIDGDLMSDKIKEKVMDRWEKIVTLLDLSETVHRRLRSFYVDGRLAYQKVVDPTKLREGLLDVIELDSQFVTKFRNVNYDQTNKTISSVKEFFVYDENVQGKTAKKTSDKKMNRDRAFELDKKHLTYVTTGLTDPITGYAISWLHKAVKPANQLRMMENSLVIYRITRAPERRIFYVDTSGMQNSKAKEFLNNLKNSYRNRMSFNPESGTFKDQRHLMTMQEDFWLPRNSSGRSTEVDTLAGGENLDQIADILYFQKELYKALNVPISRLDPESSINFGRQTEVSRDELKLSKLVSKIRKRFNLMFLDLLETELILCNIISKAEWDNVKQKIKFKYSQDLYLEELKKFELMSGRIDVANNLLPFVGKYYSNDFVRRNIFNQVDEEIEEQDKLIEKEATDKKYKKEEEL